MTAQNPQAAMWAPEECAQQWQRVVAAGPMAEAILAAAGGAFPAAGSLGPALEITRQGQALSFSWSAAGEMSPYDVVGALQERGVTVTMVGCSQVGVGEFSKVYNVAPSAGAPFQLGIYDRQAPTADAWSFYNPTATFGAGVQTIAQLRADGMEWTERCAY